MSVGVGVMTRAPSAPGKTRLAPHLSPERLTSLRAAMLADTVDAVSTIADVTIFFTPDTAAAEIAATVGSARGSAAASVVPLVPQIAGDLGARMLGALSHLLDTRDHGAAILVGSDIALLTAHHLTEAASRLHESGGVVLGPADDGGYYLIGMTEPHAALFGGIAWGTESVLTDTLRVAERIGVEARLARSAYDVDTIDDLLRLERDLAWAPAAVYPAVRRWFLAGHA